MCRQFFIHIHNNANGQSNLASGLPLQTLTYKFIKTQALVPTAGVADSVGLETWTEVCI
jgi:hypothetical protein